MQFTGRQFGEGTNMQEMLYKFISESDLTEELVADFEVAEIIGQIVSKEMAFSIYVSIDDSWLTD